MRRAGADDPENRGSVNQNQFFIRFSTPCTILGDFHSKSRCIIESDLMRAAQTGHTLVNEGEKTDLSLDERYAAYKQKQADDKRAAQQAEYRRASEKREEAREWLINVLNATFPTETPLEEDVITVTEPHERIGPVYGLECKGHQWWFHSKEKGTLSLYTPNWDASVCNSVTTFGQDFAERDFYDAVDKYFQRKG